MSEIIQLRHPWQAKDGEVIVLNPINSTAARWTVVGRRRVTSTETGIDYEDCNGDEGLVVLGEDRLIAVELAALLSPSQRAGEMNALSNWGTGRITRWLFVHHPALFDQAVAAFHANPYTPEVA